MRARFFIPAPYARIQSRRAQKPAQKPALLAVLPLIIFAGQVGVPAQALSQDSPQPQYRACVQRALNTLAFYTPGGEKALLTDRNVSTFLKNASERQKVGIPLRLLDNSKYYADHFEKHGEEFRSIYRGGIKSMDDYIAHAREFAEETGDDHIVFASNAGDRIYKIDFRTRRVLILGSDGTFISFFVGDDRMGWPTVYHQAYYRMYLGIEDPKAALSQ